MMKKFQHNLESIFELNQPVEQTSEKRFAPEKIIYVDIDQLRPSRFQPRKDFNDERLADLQRSIEENGILQPILIHKVSDHNDYEIIAGERRWRAARLANIPHIPAIEVRAKETDLAAFSLLENIQREDLNPIEEAEGYHKLLGDFQMTQEEIAGKLGKKRTTITNLLRLLSLPTKIQEQIRDRQIQMGHAKLLITIQESKRQQMFADKVVNKRLTVRQLERELKDIQQSQQQPEVDLRQVKDLEYAFAALTKRPVKINLGKNSSKLTIHFQELSDLEQLLEDLRVFEGVEA